MFKLKSKLVVAIMVMLGIIAFMSCEKNESIEQGVEKISETDLENLTDAFIYSTNLNENKSSSGIITDPEILEQRLLDDLSEKYGSEFVIEYNNNKPLFVFGDDNFKSLLNIQIEFNPDNEGETKKFIEDVFASSRKLYLTNQFSSSVNKKLAEFNSSLEDEMKNIFVKSIKENKINLSNLYNDIYAKINAFESNIRISSDITSEQKTLLLNGTLLSKVNLINSIEFADKYPLQLKKGWFKNLVKTIIKVIVTVVVVTVSTLVGMLVGSVTFNSNVVALCGVVGAVVGFKISEKINKWVETW